MGQITKQGGFIKALIQVERMLSISDQGHYLCAPNFWELLAGVVKLVDTLDLGSSAERCVGSSPSTRTKNKVQGSNLAPFIF